MNQIFKKLKPRASLMLRMGLFTSSLSLLINCGADEKKTEQPNQDSTTIIISGNGQGSKKINIPVSLAPAVSSAQPTLNLVASATAYSLDLTGCLSGYTATVTEANLDGLEVYKNDRSCLAKLTQFTVNGTTYFPTAADPFTTWANGDTAIFDEVGEPGTTPLKVIVTSTLNSPISGTESISYGFSENIAGGDQSILWSTMDAGTKITVAANTPPSYQIYSVELVDLEVAAGPNKGSGQFKFKMECNSDIALTSTCETVDFSDLDYKLVEDTYSSTLTQGEADTIFSSAGSTITEPADRIAPATEGTTNGGFVTSTLYGPKTLALKPNMILIIRSYSKSYQYFNVDVTITN
jgi:hypothetical protein